MEVGDGGVDLLLHLRLVPSFQFGDGLVHFVHRIVLVSEFVSLVGVLEELFGLLKVGHRVAGLFRGLEFVEGFAQLGHIAGGVGVAGAEGEQGAGEDEAEGQFHNVRWFRVWVRRESPNDQNRPVAVI